MFLYIAATPHSANTPLVVLREEPMLTKVKHSGNPPEGHTTAKDEAVLGRTNMEGLQDPSTTSDVELTTLLKPDEEDPHLHSV